MPTNQELAKDNIEMRKELAQMHKRLNDMFAGLHFLQEKFLRVQQDAEDNAPYLFL